MSGRHHQIRTRSTTAAGIMRDKRFQRGFADARAGLPPCFDDDVVGQQWGYERGRQFAVVAPRNLKLLVNGKLNPKALTAYEKHLAEGGL